MSDFTDWRRALEVLPTDEAEELRRLMRQRMARSKPRVAPKPPEDDSQGTARPPVPNKPDCRIYHVPFKKSTDNSIPGPFLLTKVGPNSGVT
jgi:hypothetical protein